MKYVKKRNKRITQQYKASYKYHLEWVDFFKRTDDTSIIFCFISGIGWHSKFIAK